MNQPILSDDHLDNPSQILQKYFGYSSFRDGQDKLITSILMRRDTLGVMPTGAGKSICYQVPALAMEGITLVISPLISLMMDQVAALNQAGVHAAYINSSLTPKQVSLALQYARQGRYKLIYVAPERLLTEEFLNFASNVNIAMVTVDEAHCISQWGQDFRPSYLKIIKFIEQLPKRPVISAFTATATKEVREDIICILRLNTPTVIVTGFDRANLYLEVRTPKNKDIEVLDYIRNHQQQCGIIYCATRKNVDDLQELLEKNGILATKYHAGMKDTERNQSQEDFIYDRKLVMVATNAFGMGIDKSNVRYVIHYNMPKNIESYYQEAGRAGRDGEASECILLYNSMDVRIHQFLIENGNENEELTREEKELIRERDEERLKKMIYYCHTKDCLREYILGYFGQLLGASCDNCINCLTEFEEVDVTDVSKDIIGCVREGGQRFGMNVIIATLMGRKIAKLSANHMTNNNFYGKRSQEGEAFLKHVLNKLIIDKYLYLSNDKYSIVKINPKALSPEQNNNRVIMKVSSENMKNNQSEARRTLRKSELLTYKGLELFDILRQVRTRLAREEGMPPYIIFSDKTLTDMVVRLPLNKTEMLQVIGVGENKFTKYGLSFIDSIQEFTQGNKEKLYYEENQEQSNSKPNPKGGNKKTEFHLTEDIKQRYKMNELTTISQFVEQLNELRDEKEMKQLKTTPITSKLKELGYLSVGYNTILGRNVTEVTDKGRTAGISTEERIGIKGNEYEIIVYDKEGQEFLLNLLIEARGKSL